MTIIKTVHGQKLKNRLVSVNWKLEIKQILNIYILHE